MSSSASATLILRVTVALVAVFSVLAAPGAEAGGGGGGLVRSPSAIKQMLLEWTKQQTTGYNVTSLVCVFSCREPPVLTVSMD